MKGYTKILCLVLLIFLVSYTHADNNDGYLKQLELELEAESELEDLQAAVKNSQPGSAVIPNATVSETELIPDKTRLITNQEDFENALKGAYAESYKLYQQLSESQKKVIYEEFSRGELLNTASLKIISVYLSSH